MLALAVFYGGTITLLYSIKYPCMVISAFASLAITTLALLTKQLIDKLKA